MTHPEMEGVRPPIDLSSYEALNEQVRRELFGPETAPLDYSRNRSHAFLVVENLRGRGVEAEWKPESDGTFSIRFIGSDVYAHNNSNTLPLAIVVTALSYLRALDEWERIGKPKDWRIDMHRDPVTGQQIVDKVSHE